MEQLQSFIESTTVGGVASVSTDNQQTFTRSRLNQRVKGTIGAVMGIISLIVTLGLAVPSLVLTQQPTVETFGPRMDLTVPPAYKWTGIKQAFSARFNREWEGWMNPLPFTYHDWLLESAFILKIGRCLSRALQGDYLERSHYRLSLCYVSGANQTRDDKRIYLFRFNQDSNSGNLSPDIRYSIRLNATQWRSLMDMSGWVNDWYADDGATYDKMKDESLSIYHLLALYPNLSFERGRQMPPRSFIDANMTQQLFGPDGEQLQQTLTEEEFQNRYVKNVFVKNHLLMLTATGDYTV